MAHPKRRVVHIPALLAQEVQAIAEAAGLPFGVVIAKLLTRGLKDAPTWLRVAALEERSIREREEVAV